jgi:hypothetical protein
MNEELENLLKLLMTFGIKSNDDLYFNITDDIYIDVDVYITFRVAGYGIPLVRYSLERRTFRFKNSSFGVPISYDEFVEELKCRLNIKELIIKLNKIVIGLV